MLLLRILVLISICATSFGDIEECETNNGGCHEQAACTNTLGSRTCKCKDGYEGNGITNCTDIDECSTNKGGCNQLCDNKGGSYECRCNAGYRLGVGVDSKTCSDIDECATNNGKGECNHICTNNVGSFVCSCNSGYLLIWFACVDINECNTNNGGCAHMCNNVVGTRTCTCRAGFALTSDKKSCNDINECSTNKGGCDHLCVNKMGSHECKCNVGYKLGTNFKTCADIDECATNKGGCNHICTNNAGSFVCSCNAGYQLSSNKLTCVDIDECAANSGGCNHLCTNKPGSYQCTCKAGFYFGYNTTKTCAGAEEWYGASAYHLWNYVSGSKGPNTWGNRYSSCKSSSQSQSPVNILTRHVVYKSDLGLLHTVNYDRSNVRFIMENRNTDLLLTLKANEGGDKAPSVSFKGSSYRLYQATFRWGSQNFYGSEHSVDWQKYAGELQLYHYNTKYTDYVEAISKAGGLLAWAHFLRIDAVSQVADKELQNLLTNLRYGAQNNYLIKGETKEVAINLIDLLPTEHQYFYTYRGSLTMPPCLETVTWVVNRNPIPVSQWQMTTFRKLRDTAMGSNVALTDHSRPVQGRYREIQTNWDVTVDDPFAGEKVQESHANISAKSTFLITTAVACVQILRVLLA